MASLFGRNRLRDTAQRLDTATIGQHLDTIRKWQDDYHSGTLKRDKETSREQAYNRDFFIDMLGYREKPATPFSFEPKMTTLKGQLPDAVLSHTDAALGVENIAAVVELKGASVALDRPQQRQGHMSPVQQGFKYKTQYRKCPFVIISNFYELRLYNDNQLDFERWTLDDLMDPADDYLQFKTFYSLLCCANFTSDHGVSTTENLLSSIRIKQQNIGKEFYERYRELRLALLRDIYRNNVATRTQFHVAIEKAQKLIDRIIFCCFAEDKGLLPDNILAQITDHAEKSAFGGSLWSTFRSFFESVDKGTSRLGIPAGYNGGLFARDTHLDSLIISDGPLRQLADLSVYDFSEDLSVNILGRIFEQSISDLEDVKAKVLAIGTTTDEALASPPKSKRRKEGIFYTPDHIVRYIVDGALGGYLRNREDELKKKHGLSMRLGEEGYDERERRVYLEYQTILHKVTIVDPACGSGAFLVGIFDHLLMENLRVDSILGGTLLTQEDYARDILSTNIYGVDLNEESVEISKLSLWLKTAHRGRRLTTLDKNIRCGNSLVNDESIAGDKAFDWETAFPDIFAVGGFDVVVGNPPYVDSESMVKYDPANREFITKNFSYARGNWDLLIPFIELALSIIAPHGRMAFITSNKWLALDYGSAIRDVIFPRLNMMCDCTMERVFESANVSSVIFGASRQDSPTISIGGLKSGQIVPVNEYAKDTSSQTAVLRRNLSLIFSSGLPVVARLDDLPTVADSGIFTVAGAATTAEAYELVELVRDGSSVVSADDFKLINTGTIDKYDPQWGKATFTYLKSKYQFPIVGRDLFKHAFPRRFSKLDRPKVIITGIRYFECFYDSKNEYLPTKSTVVVTGDATALGWLTAILNSTFITQYIRVNYLSSSMGGGINFTPDLVRDLPLVVPNLGLAVILAGLTESAHEARAALSHASLRLQRLVALEYGLTAWPNKLAVWWELPFEEFITSLKVSLSLKQKSDILELFEKEQPTVASLAGALASVVAEIDNRVRILYGLTKSDYIAFTSA